MARTTGIPDDDLRRRPRQRRAHDTVAFVLEAAAQLFAERGYDATTTNAVAERAGVSVGTLYQYFASKDGLLLGLLDQHLTDAETMVAARFRDVSSGRPDTAAHALVALTAEHNTHHPQLARLLHEQAPRSARLQARLVELRAVIANQLTAHLDPHGPPPAPAGGRTRTELRIELCVRLVEHLVHATSLDPPSGADRPAVLAEITTLAARCLAGDPSTGPASDPGPRAASRRWSGGRRARSGRCRVERVVGAAGGV